MADPENSVFFDHYLNRGHPKSIAHGSWIEGIGRPQVEPSFVAEVIDAMVKVPDAHSLAALRYLEEVLYRRCGGSTGTIFCAMLSVVAQMQARGAGGSVVGILCDGGERFLHSYYNNDWLVRNGLRHLRRRRADPSVCVPVNHGSCGCTRANGSAGYEADATPESFARIPGRCNAARLQPHTTYRSGER